VRESAPGFAAAAGGNPRLVPSRLSTGALATGFALGALFDGILLHQILSWHHLTSGYELELREDTLWDGVFNLAMWLVLVAGLVVLRGEALQAPETASARRLVASALVGWGVFHLVDQALFHLALRAHHIRAGENAALYDWGFAAIGILLVVAGWIMAARSRRAVPDPS
jgi:uncharacterized membrane protein